MSADVPRILGGSPTDDETAAIAAVFAQLLAERAASTERIAPARIRSTWERTARPLRHPPVARPRWDDAPPMHR